MKDNSALTCIGLFALIVISIIVGSIVNGYVLSILWGWFVIPVFKAPALSITTAIGLSLVINMLISRSNSSNKEKKEIGELIGETIGSTIFLPLFTLFIGWIVKLFM
jgi:hypothetical protein